MEIFMMLCTLYFVKYSLKKVYNFVKHIIHFINTKYTYNILIYSTVNFNIDNIYSFKQKNYLFFKNKI